MPILETKQLNKWFGGLHVTGNVDFKIEKREVHCLVGPNGAGKSTLFKLILGQILPNSGDIYFNNENITKLPSFQRINKGLSVKFQVPGIFNEMSTRQNLEVSIQRVNKNYHEIERKTEELISFLNLSEQAKQSAGNLSHGQKQWLEIGMALALEPELLLLDEPTAGMTPDETFHTGEMIKELNEQGVSILIVEHDMNFVRQIAKRVTVLNQGQIFASGSIEEIENNEEVIDIYLGKSYE